jgi:NTE family protein
MAENALILAGAVAKGAFEAGALQVLAERGVQFRRIVATSVGSLNGAILAAGIRVGRYREVADSLVELWTNRARWQRVFRFDVRALFGLRGLSRTTKIVQLLEEQIPRWLDAPGVTQRQVVELRMVLSLVNGKPPATGTASGTTFEHVVSFDGEQLDDPKLRPQLIAAATASAAFPIVFLPVDMDALGPAVDGGAVNNTPVKHAIAGTPVSRVFLIDPRGEALPAVKTFSGQALAERLADIVTGERLCRDLHEAHSVNASLAALGALVKDGTLSTAQLDKVKGALRWQAARPLEFTCIRPLTPLAGNAFTGFFKKELREAYIRSGREAAEHALGNRTEAPVAAAPPARAAQ